MLTLLPSSYPTTSYAGISPHLCAVLGLRMLEINQTWACRFSMHDLVKINHDSNLPCEFQGLPSLQKSASGRNELWLNQLILGNEVTSTKPAFCFDWLTCSVTVGQWFIALAGHENHMRPFKKYPKYQCYNLVCLANIHSPLLGGRVSPLPFPLRVGLAM